MACSSGKQQRTKNNRRDPGTAPSPGARTTTAPRRGSAQSSIILLAHHILFGLHVSRIAAYSGSPPKLSEIEVPEFQTGPGRDRGMTVPGHDCRRLDDLSP